MKFGIMLPHYGHVASTEAIVEMAKAAEAMGYDSLWVTDQIIVPNQDVDRFGPTFFECLTVLSFVAACTENIQLGSSIIVLPYRNPIEVAKVTATIDALSHGRLIVGVGIGGVESEFRNIGVAWEDRGERSDEALRIIKELWTSDKPRFDGSHYKFSDIQFHPKPVQKPHPPLWVGGNTRRALRRVVEFGDVWHPSRAKVELLTERTPQLRSIAERAGRDPGEIGISVRQPLRIDQDATQAVDAWPLVGTVDKVIESVEAFGDAGVEHLVMDTFYGIPELHGETYDDIMRTMEVFASDVVPRFAAS